LSRRLVADLEFTAMTIVRGLDPDAFVVFHPLAAPKAA
jgi:hypothetical protein